MGRKGGNGNNRNKAKKDETIENGVDRSGWDGMAVDREVLIDLLKMVIAQATTTCPQATLSLF